MAEKEGGPRHFQDTVRPAELVKLPSPIELPAYNEQMNNVHMPNDIGTFEEASLPSKDNRQEKSHIT